MSVSSEVEELSVSYWHVLHLFRAIFLWCCFATCQELSAYCFDSLRAELGASLVETGLFAATFPAGCTIGGAALSLLGDDFFSRRRLLLVSLCAAAALGLAAAQAMTLAALFTLRLAQSVAWSVALTTTLVWYTEFLPRRGRGSFMNALSVSWPCGRQLIITLSSGAADASDSPWRRLFLMNSGLFLVGAVLVKLAPESPRWLASTGDEGGAMRVLRTMGSRVAPMDGAGGEEAGTVNEAGPLVKGPLVNQKGFDSPLCHFSSLRAVVGPRHRVFFTFAAALMCSLSVTTVLLDNWGPRIFGQLMHGSTSPPLRTLAIFNAGDLCGIFVSIVAIDRIGRRGCFVVGFLVQGALLACMVGFARWPDPRDLMPRKHATLVTIGALASATRCFGWEAANLWIVEVFPTHLRSTALAAVSTCMRLASSGTLALSGSLVGVLPPGAALLTIATLQLASGVMAVGLLPKETARLAMVEAY